MKEERNINIEILRIISMLMIVILHFLLHGNVLDNIMVKDYKNETILFLLETISIVAVNIYILISRIFS